MYKEFKIYARFKTEGKRTLSDEKSSDISQFSNNYN